VEVVLGAGRLKLLARLAADKPPVEDQLKWTVFESRVENEEDGRGAQVALSYDSQPAFTLPAGLYVVVAKRGDAETTSDVEVAAGEERRHEVVIAAGRVKLVPKLSAAGQPITGNLAWRVLSPTEDIEGKRERVALSYEDAPVFTLPSGKYRLHVKRGEATKEIDLETSAGKDPADRRSTRCRHRRGGRAARGRRAADHGRRLGRARGGRRHRGQAGEDRDRPSGHADVDIERRAVPTRRPQGRGACLHRHRGEGGREDGRRGEARRAVTRPNFASRRRSISCRWRATPAARSLAPPRTFG
jgi:hypothetical protein